MTQDRYAQLLENQCQTSPSAWPRIQRVAHHLRNREAFEKYYSPKMLSLGPIHHGEPHLRFGEQYKLMWASMYVQRDRNKARGLHREILVNIKDLKDLYTSDAIRSFDDDGLAWMLFVDGCALLQILKHPDILRAKVDQLALVRQDALLLENQLPFRLLQLLSGLPDDKLVDEIDNFLLWRHFSPDQKPQKNNNGAEGADQPQPQCMIDVDPPLRNPAHLLDEMRMKVLREFRPHGPKRQIGSSQLTYRNLKELKAAGIQVRRSKSQCPIDITFSFGWFSGELKLPGIIVDDTTAPTYLNLMAYESCPDFKNKYEISSYVEFLVSMIECPDDVKELRSRGCMWNAFGSDDEIVNIFNFVAADLVPNPELYGPIRDDIEGYFRTNKYRTWIAQAYHACFSNSGSFIAFLAACLALVLTFLQTWFTIHPSK